MVVVESGHQLIERLLVKLSCNCVNCATVLSFCFTVRLVTVYRLESAIPLLQQKLSSLPDAGHMSIAFPDDGAYKRFHMYFDADGDSIIICNKVRDGDKRIVKVKEGR